MRVANRQPNGRQIFWRPCLLTFCATRRPLLLEDPHGHRPGWPALLHRPKSAMVKFCFVGCPLSREASADFPNKGNCAPRVVLGDIPGDVVEVAFGEGESASRIYFAIP